MARVYYTLASPYRNLPTLRVASAVGSGIDERSAIRAVTCQGRASRSIWADRIAGVSTEDPGQWSHAIRILSNGGCDSQLGPTNPLRVPPQGSKSVTVFVTLF